MKPVKQRAAAVIEHFSRDKKLSHPFVYIQNRDDDGVILTDEVTWCCDKINDNDEKYIGNAVMPQDLLKKIKGRWQLKWDTNHYELVNMEGFGTSKFKNEYIIIPDKSLNEIFSGKVKKEKMVCEITNVQIDEWEVFEDKNVQGLLILLEDLIYKPDFEDESN